MYLFGQNETNNGDGEDIISKLPDCVLISILSFIPYKEIVQTSILSTRWQHLWTSITNIDLNNMFGCKVSFLNFVDRVLLLHDTSAIKTFRLCFHDSVDSFYIDSWVFALVKHNVEELELILPIETNLSLPCCLFTWESLIVLKLDLNCVLKVPTSVRFPRLKELHLSSVILLVDSLDRLLSNCQVLQDLSFAYCRWINIKSFEISIPSLKRFTFTSYSFSHDRVINCKIKIHASSLVSLRYVSDFTCDCALYNLPYSVNASIDIWNLREEVVDRALRLLNCVQNVKSLAIIGDNQVEGGDLAARISTFYKLTTLELQLEVTYETTRLLMNFLQKAPILEFLEITIRYPYEEVDLNEDWGMDVIPSCLDSHLKTINITYFNGFKEELHMVEHVLKNAAVLERILINGRKELFSNFEMLKQVRDRIQIFPRSSKSCVIELLESNYY